MKVLLVNPAGKESVSYIPLGLSYIASMLEKKGYDISCLDLRFIEDVPGKVRKENPDVVGITCRYDNYASVSSIAKSIKQTKNIPVIAGGPFPTNCPEEALSCEYIDYVVIGEGEGIILKLMDALEAGSGLESVDGIGYSYQGRIKINTPSEYIKDLDSVPFPKRDIFDVYSYARDIRVFPMPAPYMHVVASRGCLANCKFCQPVVRRLFGEKPRFRSPGNVIAEIQELIEKYRIRAFGFMDDTLTANKEWLFGLCEALIRKNINKKTVWLAQSRVDAFDTETAEVMKQAGCRLVIFGVESGSQRVLNYLRKGIKVEQSYKALRVAKRTGLIVQADTMIGMPYETEEDLKKTAQLYRKLKPEIIQTSLITPVPGTDFCKEAKEKGFLSADNVLAPARNSVKYVKRCVPEERLWYYLRQLNRYEIRISSLASAAFTKLIILRWWSFIRIKKIEGIIFDAVNILLHGVFHRIIRKVFGNYPLYGLRAFLKKIEIYSDRKTARQIYR